MRKSLMTTCSLLVIGMLTGAAEAADPTISVWTIRATEKNKQISKDLKPLANVLKKRFKYTGYSLVKKDAKPVKFNTAGTFSLSDGYKAKIKPAEKGKDKIQFSIEVTRRVGGKEVRKFATNVTIKRGKSTVLGGWDLKGGDVLVIAVGSR